MAACLPILALQLGCDWMDGPVAMFPGGPLRSGTLIETPVSDWRFVDPVEEIELQLMSQDRSRTTWILYHDERAFVPASIGFPPGKHWHERALEDGRALLRISGSRYPVLLTRVEDPVLIEALGEADIAKYPQGPPGDEIWYFAIASRTP